MHLRSYVKMLGPRYRQLPWVLRSNITDTDYELKELWN